ncbi:glycosyltransferase family 8 protein [Brachyspira murdochii]|uniref:Glycosyl transferase family 8 n=1 Tax=Brachyspira murdochii (strain ATCC 51284 / DSM 12563 / 56-150) TaxID=526224 RepID=D5U7Y0_BRAM5|nr:glycosyltransferase family 8 protein [Brachyspira murdochii]ADG70803.1 glycosyl transferase family 8 [Brachyspira murdochii DSM 12563]
MRMDICLSADDNYAKYMGTTIASILSNSKEDEEIYFHLLDGGITEENKNKLLSLKKIKNCDMKFYVPDFEKYKKWYELGNYNGRFSPAMFYRLDIHILMPDIDKVLYLDCDTIVRSSLKELFEIDINNYYALVADNARNNNYFNSGVILFNSQLCREINIEKSYNDFFYKNNGKVWTDEEILNECLKNRVKFIEPKWNFFANKIQQYYIDYNLNDVKIIHYMSFKPWKSDCRSVIFIDEFWKYYQLTPWFLERPIDAIQTILAQKYGDYEETKLKINDVRCFGVYHNRNTLKIVIFFIKIRIEMSFKNVNKIAWFIPVKKWREAFRRAFDV